MGFAAKRTDVTRELFIPANEGYIEAGTRINRSSYAVVQGAADTDTPIIWFTVKVPDDFVSFTKVEAVWASPAVTGNMWWGMGADYAAVGEDSSMHSDNPEAGETATGGADIMNVQRPKNPLTLADLAAGDYLGLVFTRYGSNAADTLDTVVDLLGILFTYTAEQ